MFVSCDQVHFSDDDDDIFITRRQKRKIEQFNDDNNHNDDKDDIYDNNTQNNQDAINNLFSQMQDGFFFDEQEANKENNNPQRIASLNNQIMNEYKEKEKEIQSNINNKRSFSDLSSDDDNDNNDNNEPLSKRRKISCINKNAFNFLTLDMITKHMKKDETMMDEVNEYVHGFQNCFITNTKLSGEIECIDTSQIYQTYIILETEMTNHDKIKGLCSCNNDNGNNYLWCKHMIALGITFIEAKESFIYKQEQDNTDNNHNELKYITMKSISEYCTDISWSRAQEYVDCFIDCNKNDKSIFGSIQGRSHPINYNVSITVKDLGELDGECSCPSHHYWCKHIGALGITFIEHNDKFTAINNINDSINSKNTHELNDDLEDNEENWLLNLV